MEESCDNKNGARYDSEADQTDRWVLQAIFGRFSHPRNDGPLTFEAGCDESSAFAANFEFELSGIRTKVGTTTVPGSIICQAYRLYVDYMP
jgi:hypothetical protein